MIFPLVLLACAAWGQRSPVSPERLALARGATEARISPDGKTAAYVLEGDLWLVPTAGGAPSRVTARGDVSDPRYAPDGRSIVFVSKGLWRVPARGGEPESLAVSTAASAPRWGGRRLAFLADGQLFVDKVQLTREAVELSRPVWSPDGKTVAVARTADGQKGELLVVDATGGAAQEIAPPHGGLILPEHYSPDGHELLCRAHNEKGFLQLYLLDVKTGRGRFIGGEEWDVQQAVHHAAAGVIYALDEGGASSLQRLPRLLGKPEALLPARGRLRGFDLDARGDRLLYVWGDSTRAADVWLLDLRTRERRALTGGMPAGLSPEGLARARFARYPTFDGRSVSALVMSPPVKRLGDPPPLVVEAHDGPDAQAEDAFSPVRQALTEAGFVVLVPDYRGSTGQGRVWQELNRADWGGGDRKDILEGVKWLAKRGEIDPKRVGIMGRGYGGYLALATLERDPGVWKTGVALDPLLDLKAAYERRPDWMLAQMGAPGPLYAERSIRPESVKPPPADVVAHFLEKLK